MNKLETSNTVVNLPWLFLNALIAKDTNDVSVHVCLTL